MQRAKHEFGYSFAVDKIRRLRLVLDLDQEDEIASDGNYALLKHTLHLACQCIASLRLLYLNIDLQSRFPITRFCILDPLRILKKVRKVTFEPESPSHIERHRRRRQCRSLATSQQSLLAKSQPRFADFLKCELQSSTPHSEDFLQTYSFQFVDTFLRWHETPFSVHQHLRLLVPNHQDCTCFKGPYKVCEHRANVENTHRSQQQVLTDSDK